MEQRGTEAAGLQEARVAALGAKGHIVTQRSLVPHRRCTQSKCEQQGGVQSEFCLYQILGVGCEGAIVNAKAAHRCCGRFGKFRSYVTGRACPALPLQTSGEI